MVFCRSFNFSFTNHPTASRVMPMKWNGYIIIFMFWFVSSMNIQQAVLMKKIEFPYSITCSFVYMYTFYLLHRTLCLRCAERKNISHFKIIIDMPHRWLMHEIGTYRNCFIFGDINRMKMWKNLPLLDGLSLDSPFSVKKKKVDLQFQTDENLALTLNLYHTKPPSYGWNSADTA